MKPTKKKIIVMKNMEDALVKNTAISLNESRNTFIVFKTCFPYY